MPRADRQAGFTLVEMLVVLAILAVVGGVVLTRGPQHSAALDMRSASATVAQALRAARGRAIAANSRVAVRFDAGTATLRLATDPVRSLPRGIGLAIAGDRPAILFLPDGSSSGGRVELAGEGRRAAVRVDWLTGRVTVIQAGADAG